MKIQKKNSGGGGVGLRGGQDGCERRTEVGSGWGSGWICEELKFL